MPDDNPTPAEAFDAWIRGVAGGKTVTPGPRDNVDDEIRKAARGEANKEKK